MTHRSTYFTDEEEQALESIAEKRDESFSGIVRDAVQEVYDL